MKQEQDNITLDQIIEQSFDFSGYSEEEKIRLIGETSGMIMETALLRALDKGGEELQKKFGDFIENEPSEEEMGIFINENIPNFPELIVEEVETFRSTGDSDND
jgi:radical SAM superfamily enzyme with C-terminal helix-hairpin-helix motif